MAPETRPFEKGDTERLREVLATVFAEYRMTFDPDGYDRDVKDVLGRYGSGIFLTVLDAGEVVGFGGADLPREGVAEIHRLYIDPKARGRGIGKLLVAELEAWARPRVPVMTLWSDVRLFHAHELYARLGYRLTGQRQLEDPDRSLEFGFRRNLKDKPDDRPFVAELETVPLATVDPHRASMLAAAILDSRTLEKLAGGAHALPQPAVLFRDGPPTTAIFQRKEILAGFSSPRERRLHPLFSSRLPRR